MQYGNTQTLKIKEKDEIVKIIHHKKSFKKWQTWIDMPAVGWSLRGIVFPITQRFFNYLHSSAMFIVLKSGIMGKAVLLTLCTVAGMFVHVC